METNSSAVQDLLVLTTWLAKQLMNEQGVDDTQDADTVAGKEAMARLQTTIDRLEQFQGRGLVVPAAVTPALNSFKLEVASARGEDGIVALMQSSQARADERAAPLNALELTSQLYLHKDCCEKLGEHVKAHRPCTALGLDAVLKSLDLFCQHNYVALARVALETLFDGSDPAHGAPYLPIKPVELCMTVLKALACFRVAPHIQRLGLTIIARVAVDEQMWPAAEAQLTRSNAMRIIVEAVRMHCQAQPDTVVSDSANIVDIGISLLAKFAALPRNLRLLAQAEVVPAVYFTLTQQFQHKTIQSQ